MKQLLAAILLSVLASAQVVHKYPAEDTNNVFTGTNQFTVGAILGPTTVALLPIAPAAGTMVITTDGTPGTSPCVGGSTGSLAIYLNGTWTCSGGGGGGGGSISGTINRIIKFTSASTGGNSSMTDTGLGMVTSPNGIDVVGNAYGLQYPNSPNGTTNGLLACIDTSVTTTSQVTTCAINTTKALGVVHANGVTTGNAEVSQSGFENCIFDGQTTIGDAAVPSGTNAGQCSDAGATRPPQTQNIGRIVTVNAGAGTAASVQIFSLDLSAPGASGGSGTVGNCGTGGSNAYYANAGIAVTCDVSTTDDGSGNVTAKSLGTTDATKAGFIYFKQGADPTAGQPANTGMILAPTSITGAPNLLMPASGSGGTIANSGVAPIVVNASTGAISCPTCGTGSGSVSSVTFTGDGTVLSSTPSSPVTTTGTLTAVLANAGAGTVLGNNTSSSATPTYSAAPVLGVDSTTAGTLQLANNAAAAHTIFASGATTTNTIKGFATVPTNGHLVTCTTASTTCTLTDGGAVPTGTVTSVGLAGTANQITVTGSTPITTSGSWTLSIPNALILGTDNSAAGTVQLANSAANAHTILSSGATTTNTIQGFATVPTTGHLIDCTVTSTTCLLHDSGVVTANVVNASSPGVGYAHFAGSTQTATSVTIPRGLAFTIGDPSNSSALTVAATTTAYLTVPFGCTISAYNLVIDTGTITVKFWKVATGTAIPTSGNSISTSGVAISSGTAIHSTTTSDFTTTTVTANDIMAMNVTAVSSAHYVQGVLQCDESQ